HLARESAVNGIVLEEVRVILGRDQVVDGDDGDVLALGLGDGAQHVTADTAEAGDRDFDCHGVLPVCSGGSFSSRGGTPAKRRPTRPRYEGSARSNRTAETAGSTAAPLPLCQCDSCFSYNPRRARRVANNGAFVDAWRCNHLSLAARRNGAS